MVALLTMACAVLAAALRSRTLAMAFSRLVSSMWASPSTVSMRASAGCLRRNRPRSLEVSRAVAPQIQVRIFFPSRWRLSVLRLSYTLLDAFSSTKFQVLLFLFAVDDKQVGGCERNAGSDHFAMDTAYFAVGRIDGLVAGAGFALVAVS